MVPTLNKHVSTGLLWLCLVLPGTLLPLPALAADGAAPERAAVPPEPLIVGHRTIHVFRAPLGAFTPADRADGARQRILQAFKESGEGWTSVKSTPQGIEVELDGMPLFFVLPGDALALSGETPEDLANRASHVLKQAWQEAREIRDPRASLSALLKVVAATALLAAVLFLIVKLEVRLRSSLVRRTAKRLQSLTTAGTSGLGRVAALLPALVARALLVLGWLLGLFLIFIYLTYSLGQFALTRPASETLAHSLTAIATHALGATAEALPGLFVAVIIFLLAWAATRVSSEFFAGVTARPTDSSLLNSHTAPATRRIVNASLWLFAIAMAYPYLPGSHTEAFKGLSVIVGLMVSIGASGVVGQIASGVMIVYTYALKKGEYVRIQDYEGTVTDLGLFVTRLRTGLGEEITLPNAFVLGNVTRNFSRVHGGQGYILDTTVTIGYDTPWRQVHELLLEAAGTIPEILATPAAYVVQTALSDFYVEYKLIVHVGSDVPATRARVASDLHAAIQDAFNRQGVQIMSPHYMDDPKTPKIVPPANT